MKLSLYNLIGKIAYWLTILTGIFAIFMLSWKIFGHSPTFDSFMSSLIVANIVAASGMYYKMGHLSGSLSHHSRYSDKRLDEVVAEIRELRQDFRNHAFNHRRS